MALWDLLTLRQLEEWFGFFNVRSRGALCDGTTDDDDALHETVERARVAGRGKIVIPGRLKYTTTLDLSTTALLSHNGIQFVGGGWEPGATPASNSGSWLEYAGTSGPAIKMYGRDPSAGFVQNIKFMDLGIMATDATFAGQLIEMRTVARTRFQNVALYGQTAPAEPLTNALIYGDQWVDLEFSEVAFFNAAHGVQQASYGGSFNSYANAVSFDGQCEFNKCTVPIDIQLNAQDIYVDDPVMEPTWEGKEATSTIVSVGIDLVTPWAGDGDDSGTWFKLGGSAITVEVPYISGGAVGIEFISGAARPTVRGGTISGCGTGILSTATHGLHIHDVDLLLIPDGGFGIDIAANSENARIINCQTDKAVGGATSTGYRLAATSDGLLVDNRAGTANTRITDNSSGAWTIAKDYQITHATAVSGFNPSRIMGVQAITNLTSDPGGGTCSFPIMKATNNLVIASGTPLTGCVVYTPTLTPASVNAATVAEQTFTVSGLTTADKVIVIPPATVNNIGIAGARVSAANTLAIRFVNPTAGALTPTSGTYTVLAFRS